jgi:hypothetical protein
MTAIVGGSSGISFPTWATSGRPSSPVVGTMGWNTDLASMENWNGSAWSSVGGGASAGGTIYTNGQTVLSSYTFTANTSGSSTGPISLANGATVTLPAGTRWVIL